MNGGRRQKVLLGVLALLALIFGWNRLGLLLSGGGDAGAGGGGGRRGGAGARAIEVVELDVDRLAHEPGAFKPGRDPFRYYQPPPPPPTGPTPEELEARRRAEEERRRLEAEKLAAAKPAGPQPPEIDLTYLGSFGPAERRIAVFTDGDEVYNALAGDVLQDQFVVDHIGLESVDLKYVDFPDLPPARLGVGG